MSGDDRTADYLETGQAEGLTPDEEARLDVVRAVLGSAAVWEQPPSGLIDNITSETLDEAGPSSINWIWGAVAVLALVLVAIPFLNLGEEEVPSAVATIALGATDLAVDAIGTADLVPTPNGWAIELKVDGLPPAEQGTFYQGWVSNGERGISVGTFHMRGHEPTPVALWSGVDLTEYSTLNITIQEEDAGPESSGQLVLTGTATEFG